MKILKYVLSIFILIGFYSCEKNTVEYNTTPVTDMAEFQLHYYVPITSVVANNIYKVEINGQLYANTTAPLATYNAIPNGSVGRFLTTNIGANNIKLYQGQGDAQKLVYDQPCDLIKGKQNIFVYDFNKPPIVFDNQYPYVTNTTQNTDSTCWVKFYNFMYEKDGVYTDLKLQYQYIDPTTKALVNVGSPVAFGETTGWQPVKVIKTKDTYNTAGTLRIDFKLKVVDANGAITGDLMIMNTKGAYVAYSDYWNESIGRRYHHVLTGMRSKTAPTVAVKAFTAL